MTVRRFDGVDDEIRTALGSCDRNAGGTTLGFLFKKLTDAAWQGIMGLHTSGGTAVQAIEIDTSNQVYWDLDVAGQSIDGTVTIANGWVMVFFGKASGTATARCSRKVMSTGVWTHQNAGTTMVDGNAPGALGTVRFGEWQDGDDFNGLLACAGVWASNLSDATRETMGGSLQAWKDSGPVGLWAFDQAAVTTAVTDLTGNGANETARTGTVVVTNDDPPNFSLSLGISQAIAAASETDSAAGLIRAKAREAGVAGETDTPGALLAAKTAVTAATSETDASATLTTTKSPSVDQTLEASTAGTLTGAKIAVITGATEADTVEALEAAHIAELDQAAEAATAAALDVARVASMGAATDSESAAALTSAAGGALGQALEADQAQALVPAKTETMAGAADTETAQTLGVTTGLSLTLADELDSAGGLTAIKTRALGPAVEGEQAVGVLVLRTLSITEALEADQAQAFELAFTLAAESSSAATLLSSKVLALAFSTEQDSALALMLGYPPSLPQPSMQLAVAERSTSIPATADAVLAVLDIAEIAIIGPTTQDAA